MGIRKGWVGFDLDGTLAHDGEWKGPYHIGPPIPKMTHKVWEALNQGHDVRIFTARVCDLRGNEDVEKVRNVIQNYTKQHFGGRVFDVTNEKDYDMITCYDDRAKQVISNTGMTLEEALKELIQKAHRIGYRAAVQQMAQLLREK